MNYTIRMFRNTTAGQNKANVKVTFNNSFDVSGIHVKEGEKGAFVTMPSYKTKNGEYKSIANPTTSEFHKQLYSDILSAYRYLEKNPDKSSFIKDSEFATPTPSQNIISVYKTKNPDSATKAMANVNIDGQFSINNIQVREGQYGNYVSMPSFKKQDGSYVNVASALEEGEFNKTFNKDVLSVFDNMEKNNLDSFRKEFLGSQIAPQNNVADYASALAQDAEFEECADMDDDLPFD